MSGVSVASNAKLSWLLLRGGVRHAAGRLNGHPVLRWPLPTLKSDRLLIAPQDLRTADATRATRNLFRPLRLRRQGRDLRRPLDLRNGAAVGGMGAGAAWVSAGCAICAPPIPRITRANARALVDEWITLQGSWHPIGWRPDVLSRRIISWLSQATLVLQDADARFYRRFLRSLVRQVRYLRHTARDARAALPHAGRDRAELCGALHRRPGAPHQIRDRTSERRARSGKSCPDGGHASRDPGAIIEILLELLPLRQAFASRNIAPPPALLNASRPHDADAALLPPFRRHVRPFQRHGRDARSSN